ncbi:hypothetical protein UFOVP343_46 [uncultured Caudovirales phage]|uniref:Uncharacterized protein n=1 Tax=uncultured Caudovirales phage TaxID=2100421 RepID=A0A6J5M5R8_9CAUD|nr:hypothetical protein UFOVP343_46 [uncultured Caudovirales phage]
MKTCKTCKEEFSFELFPKSKQSGDGLHAHCRKCWSVRKADDYKKRWFVYQARLKKAECKKKGLPYDLTPAYLESIWTEECPVFGRPFVRFDKTHSDGPALDRIIPSLGYVKGNVVYISSRANRIKYDATVEELRQVLKFVEGATTISQESTPKRVEAPDSRKG